MRTLHDGTRLSDAEEIAQLAASGAVDLDDGARRPTPFFFAGQMLRIVRDKCDIEGYTPVGAIVMAVYTGHADSDGQYNVAFISSVTGGVLTLYVDADALELYDGKGLPTSRPVRKFNFPSEKEKS